MPARQDPGPLAPATLSRPEVTIDSPRADPDPIPDTTTRSAPRRKARLGEVVDTAAVPTPKNKGRVDASHTPSTEATLQPDAVDHTFGATQVAPRASQFGEEPTPPSTRAPRRRDLPQDQSQDSGPTPNPAPPPPQTKGAKLLFPSARKYALWQQLFPPPATPAFQRGSFKWEDFCAVMVSEPLCFELEAKRTPEYKWKRTDKGDGWPSFVFTAHMPHDGVVQKSLIRNLATRLRRASGWEGEDFGEV